MYATALRHRDVQVVHRVEPMTKKPVGVARNLRDRKSQRALMQFFKPENDFEVKERFCKQEGPI
jgi:hypothetical protein